jgi:hypothetical protein
VAVLLAFDFEVIVTVATHNVPAANPVTVTGLLAADEDKFVVNTTVLSAFFFTETSIVTPSFGNVEVILALIATVAPTTGKIVL